ncbi:MAG: hypothetical protein BRD30_04570, partial [Bacteroidetes bacterium QH_2_63_10]
PLKGIDVRLSRLGAGGVFLVFRTVEEKRSPFKPLPVGGMLLAGRRLLRPDVASAGTHDGVLL